MRDFWDYHNVITFYNLFYIRCKLCSKSEALSDFIMVCIVYKIKVNRCLLMCVKVTHKMFLIENGLGTMPYLEFYTFLLIIQRLKYICEYFFVVTISLSTIVNFTWNQLNAWFLKPVRLKPRHGYSNDNYEIFVKRNCKQNQEIPIAFYTLRLTGRINE